MASQYNPAAEGIRAAREDDERMALQDRARQAAANACAEDAHVEIAEIVERLLETDGYLKSGNHLAAVGTYDGVSRMVEELSFLIRRLQRKAVRS